MWPYVVGIGCTCFAISGIDNITVVHLAVAIIIELCEVEVGIILSCKLQSLSHHIARIGICARIACIAAIISRRFRKRIRTYNLKVGHILSHRIVAIIILHTTSTAIYTISRLVKPTVEVGILITHSAVAKVDKYNKILRLLYLSVLSKHTTWSNNLLVKRFGWSLTLDTVAFKIIGIGSLRSSKP